MIARNAAFDAGEVAEAVTGTWDAGAGPTRLEGVATDTRDPLEGRLFVALVGKRFDAHEFLRAAVEGGASGLLVARSAFARVGGRDAVGEGVQVVAVEDTLEGLADLARHHRRRVGVPVVALTGSNGKTSTKEMLRAALGVDREVLATEGNLNNRVGLPLTLLGLEPGRHEICVAEMGMNALGEIAAMVRAAEPEVGLVTNIGPAHIGELGSLENIARAKGEMYQGLDKASGTAVVNLDDPRVLAQADAAGVQRRVTFGSASGADVRLVEIEPVESGQRLRLELSGREIEVALPLPGRHNAMNAAAALAAAVARPGGPPDPEAMARALSGLEPAPGRSQVRQIGAYTVVDDSYNANEASALAAVELARTLAAGRRLVCAFGEMRELGAFSEAAHRAVGAQLRAAGAAAVAAFGPEAAPVASAAGGNARHEADDLDALVGWLFEQLEPGDVLLVKGSRGSRMERVVARLEEVV